MFKLQGTLALVTVASKSIGQGIAEVFAKAGAHVVVAARNAEKGRKVVAEINACGGRAQWLETDRSSYKVGQLVCGLILLLGTLAIPLSQPLPWLATIIVFLWGGAIGGINTLAVIEAGDRVGEHQVSTAMTAIAMFYTLGSVLGPIATGATVSYVSEHGLMISVGTVGALFIAMLILRRAPAQE